MYCGTDIIPANTKLDFTPQFYIGEISSSSPSSIGYTYIQWCVKGYDYITAVRISNDGINSPTLNKQICNWASDRINLAYTFTYIMILGV